MLITPHRHVVHLALRHLPAKKTHLNPADGGLTLFLASLHCLVVRILLIQFWPLLRRKGPAPRRGGRGPRRGPLVTLKSSPIRAVSAVVAADWLRLDGSMDT